jgi:hypothetical protein
VYQIFRVGPRRVSLRVNNGHVSRPLAFLDL